MIWWCQPGIEPVRMHARDVPSLLRCVVPALAPVPLPVKHTRMGRPRSITVDTLPNMLQLLLALSHLNERDREIWVDYRACELPSSTLAEREGVTRARIQQRVSKADTLISHHLQTPRIRAAA